MGLARVEVGMMGWGRVVMPSLSIPNPHHGPTLSKGRQRSYAGAEAGPGARVGDERVVP